MEHLWTVELREPLVELQELSELEGDPQRQWSAWNMQKYEQSGLFRIEFYGLFSAWNVISRQSLGGVLDIVPTRAMEFALDLQAAFPEAGTVGGPTVATEPALAQTVYNITNNITGDGTNIATGQGAHQTSTVAKGDSAALLTRLAELGLGSDDRDEFAAAIAEEKSLDGPRTASSLPGCDPAQFS